MLSIIIPSYKDPLLQKTIDSLLENSEKEIEIIVVLDGYKPELPLRENPRVKILPFEKNLGMRNAINSGVKISKGEYIMKCDEHCKFGKGFDRILLEEIKDNWVVIPRLYKLDTEKWEVMEGRGNDYNKLVIHESTQRLTGLDWIRRTKERKDILIDETMSFQGSCWLTSRKWWDTAIRELEEKGYGKFAQEATEIGMKTFVAGGKVMVNKKTWYAHKHRKFGRPYGISGEEIKAGNDYSLNLWKDEYQKLKKYFGI